MDVMGSKVLANGCPCPSLICSAGFKEHNGNTWGNVPCSKIIENPVKQHTIVQSNLSRRFVEDSADVNERDSTRR